MQIDGLIILWSLWQPFRIIVTCRWMHSIKSSSWDERRFVILTTTNLNCKYTANMCMLYSWVYRSFHPPAGIFRDAFICFSFKKNAAQIFDTNIQSSAISSINGIRTLSMFWVILGHTFFFAMYAPSGKNLIQYWYFYWIHQTVPGCGYVFYLGLKLIIILTRYQNFKIKLYLSLLSQDLTVTHYSN